MRLQEFPRHPLTFGPSPVHPLQRLTAHLGGAAVWAKREDVSSGLAYGGNKTRKLEYIVPDALAQGADTLVSIGGYQSNHTRQVAAVAAHLGLKCRLVQEKWVDWDDPVNDKVGNILLSRIMGADVRLDPHGFDIGIRHSWEEAIAEVEASGGTPYPIPAGASEHPLGGLGFANWAFEVAAQEEQLGLKAVLVQERWVDWDDPVNDKVGNILLSRIMGADVRLDPSGFGIEFKDSWERALEDVRRDGGVPYAIPAGASDHPLGGLGFANWADEVRRQEAELGVFFDTIIVCSVTGSTHAGMIAGFAGQDRPRRVLGIDASAKIDATREQVARIARDTAERIGLGRDLRDDEITVLEGWAGDLYGIPVQSTIDAITLTGRLEGMIIDPVYEGKSMAGLIDLVTSGEIPSDSTVLYAHLGGQPALNAYSGIFD